MTQPRTFRSEFLLLLIVLAASPIPLGSNRDWAWPILSLLICIAALPLVLSVSSFQSRHIKVVIGSFAFLLTITAAQWIGIGFIDTTDRFLTGNELLKTLTYGAFFFCSVSLLKTDSRILLCLYTVTVVALLEALIGGVQQLIFGQSRATGTYPNPNHFAGYLAMCIGLGIGVMLAIQKEPNDNKAFSFLDWLTGAAGRMRVVLIILVIALVMSRSRMGNIAFFTSVLLTAGVAYYYSRTLNRYMVVLIVSILAIDLLIIGSYFGLDRLEDRFRQAAQETSMRINLQGYHLQMLRDRPIFGSGAGSYETTFAPYRDAWVPKKPTHAENDYAELLVELGIIGSLPLLVILGTGLHAQVQLLKTHHRHFDRGIAFGCFCGTVALLIHAWGDVNLQIPANSLLFILMLALPMALLERALLEKALLESARVTSD